jgi:hypothetical protein
MTTLSDVIMLADHENQICASTPNVIGPANYQSSLEVCDAVLQILQEDKRWELGKLDYSDTLASQAKTLFHLSPTSSRAAVPTSWAGRGLTSSCDMYTVVVQIRCLECQLPVARAQAFLEFSRG